MIFLIHDYPFLNLLFIYLFICLFIYFCFCLFRNAVLLSLVPPLLLCGISDTLVYYQIVNNNNNSGGGNSGSGSGNESVLSSLIQFLSRDKTTPTTPAATTATSIPSTITPSTIIVTDVNISSSLVKLCLFGVLSCAQIVPGFGSFLMSR